MIRPVLLFLTAYIAGSVNFSILLFKILGKEDPRKNFSGNPGAVNVYRQAGLLWAGVVLVLDMSRAMGIALLSIQLLPTALVPWSGLCLIVGNRFPCFHEFKGGKGVANYLGFTLMSIPVCAFFSALIWCIVYAFFRVPFIGSLTMVLILAAGTAIEYDFHLIPTAGVFITITLIFYNHRQNIQEFLGERWIGRR